MAKWFANDLSGDPRKIDNSFDNYFLDCALSAKARFIVSSDKHLLKLVNFKGIPIIKPRVFIIQAL